MQNIKIMVVEDELEIAELIKDYLEEEQYEVIISTDGKQCIELFREFQPQLIILDIMLPRLDGIEVCRIIRSESTIPIIMLSAKKTEVDKILGLGIGADDYVVKPFSPSEVVARVKAQLRRYHQLSEPTNKVEVFSFKDLELDFSAYTVKLNGKYIEFTVKEFESLRFLALHPNQVLSRKQIYENVWGYNEYGDLNTVTIHIKKIREKLEDNLLSPKYIKTVRGIGYKFGGETS